MKTTFVREGAIRLKVPDPKAYALTKQAPAFYNPAMILNRDISILICKLLKPKSAVDLLAATGVRGLRLKKESGVENVYINDANPVAVKLIKENAKLNKLNVHFFNLRAHEFLATRYKLKHPKFDYVDVDPFGSPTPFLDAAVKALAETGGIIGITATDTSALCGTYPDACLRKYGAKPLYNYLMNEIGLRILIKKVQEVGSQYDLALTPIFSHTTRHYMRAYLQAGRGAGKANEILKQIGFYKDAGPIWLGKLWDEMLVEKMLKLARPLTSSMSEEAIKTFKLGRLPQATISQETVKLLYTIAEESKIPTVGFYDLSEMKLKRVPRISDVIARLQEKNFKAARTHFSPTGIRTNANEKEFATLLRAVA